MPASAVSITWTEKLPVDVPAVAVAVKSSLWLVVAVTLPNSVPVPVSAFTDVEKFASADLKAPSAESVVRVAFSVSRMNPRYGALLREIFTERMLKVMLEVSRPMLRADDITEEEFILKDPWQILKMPEWQAKKLMQSHPRVAEAVKAYAEYFEHVDFEKQMTMVRPVTEESAKPKEFFHDFTTKKTSDATTKQTAE